MQTNVITDAAGMTKRFAPRRQVDTIDGVQYYRMVKLTRVSDGSVFYYIPDDYRIISPSTIPGPVVTQVMETYFDGLPGTYNQLDDVTYTVHQAADQNCAEPTRYLMHTRVAFYPGKQIGPNHWDYTDDSAAVEFTWQEVLTRVDGGDGCLELTHCPMASALKPTPIAVGSSASSGGRPSP